MFLREYVYVDIDKVRGLAGQLYDGIAEKATNIAARQKRIDIDIKVLRGGGTTGSEDSTERSIGDSLFKDLEADLEALGMLSDISAELGELETWKTVESLAPRGRIVRITAPGSLFHPGQMSDAIVGMVTAAHGLSDLSVAEASDSSSTPRGTKNNPKGADRRPRPKIDGSPQFPEDLLPPGNIVPIMDVKRDQLAGMIRVIRGVFGEGVHVHLRPAGSEGPIISARLEPGRKYLDSSPEVLFSRYGLGQQEWTVVGVVGQLGSSAVPDEIDDVMHEDGSVNRAKLVDLVGHFLGQTAGLIDLPQAPGFSLVPLAVYRTLGEGTFVGPGQ